jgi:glycerol kinase
MMAETVALGAAYGAGLVVGYWTDRAQFRQNWHRAAEWTPQIQEHQRRAEFDQWKHAVQLAIHWSERPRP